MATHALTRGCTLYLAIYLVVIAGCIWRQLAIGRLLVLYIVFTAAAAAAGAGAVDANNNQNQL